jgi:TorA maturation chaperone TorD
MDSAEPNLTISTDADFSAAASTFELLARSWILELDRGLVAALNGDEIGSAFSALGGHLPVLSEHSIDAVVEALAIEYCQCFLGPKGHLPPHQSVVASSRFQGDCVESMGQFVDIIGIPAGVYQEQQLLDHAGIQLAMLAKIYRSLSIASETEDIDSLKSLQDLRQEFFNQHLSWLIDYCVVAEQKTTSKFYRGVFRVTKAALENN